MFMVNVRLVDRKLNSHAGRVNVTNEMVQYSALGTTVSSPSSKPPSMLNVDCASVGGSAGMVEKETFGLMDATLESMAETFANGELASTMLWLVR
jgi:hypothetical protein